MQGKPLHHLRKQFLVARRVVCLTEQFHDGGILPLFQKQVHLAREQRLDVIRLRQKRIVNLHQFLLVLHGLEEQAVIVKQRHVLIMRRVERGLEILAGGIGDAFPHVKLREQLQLTGENGALVVRRLSRNGERRGIVTVGKESRGHRESEIAATGVGFVGTLPKDFGQLLFATKFHLLRADKRFMSHVQILGHVHLLERILNNGRIGGGKRRLVRLVLLAGRRGAGAQRERQH